MSKWDEQEQNLYNSVERRYKEYTGHTFHKYRSEREKNTAKEIFDLCNNLYEGRLILARDEDETALLYMLCYAFFKVIGQLETGEWQGKHWECEE